MKTELSRRRRVTHRIFLEGTMQRGVIGAVVLVLAAAVAGAAPQVIGPDDRILDRAEGSHHHHLRRPGQLQRLRLLRSTSRQCRHHRKPKR